MTEIDAQINYPAILIKLTLHDIERMTENDIYEAARKSWRIAEHRRNNGPLSPEFAVSIYKQHVVAVYRILQWEPTNDVSRWAFMGELDSEKTESIKGKSVAHFYRIGEQNPIKYINFVDPGEPSLGVEDLVEAIINKLHFEKSKHPHYWSLKIDLLRKGLGVGPNDKEGDWLEEVLNGHLRLTTHILPTEMALELSGDIPIGAATFMVYQEYVIELARMREDLVNINREFLSVLITESLGVNATRRVPVSDLLAAGLPELEPGWDVLDWMENY